MKSVPLVVYNKDNERLIIGQAELTDDDHGILVSASILPEHVHRLAPASEDFSIKSETFPSVAERHAAKYGAPIASAFSISAWAEEVERISKLDPPKA